MRLHRDFRFHTERANYGRDVRIYLANELPDGSVEVIEAPKTRRIEPGEVVTDDALLTIRPEQAQQLMDALWASGFRPVDGHGSTGQLGAVQEHLRDMRLLVANVLDVQLPGTPDKL